MTTTGGNPVADNHKTPLPPARAARSCCRITNS